MKEVYSTGIVSEIRVATLVSSENRFIKYPANVVVHVTERSMDGEIMHNGCVVNEGQTFVTAKGAKFIDMSPILPIQWSELDIKKIREILDNFKLYQSTKLLKTEKTGILID
jgi:hypothetical protein